MKIKDILRQKGREVITIEVDRTVHEAVCKLNKYGIGALVVTGEGGEIRGIITERDILRECGERCVRMRDPAHDDESPCPSLVEDVMTQELIIGVPEDGLGYVMGIMTKNRIRHLPVMDEERLVGIISIGDVVNAHLEKTEFENRLLRDYIHGVTR
jgi:CBS domain-containing protein